jgi:hypothetical protein
MASGNPFLVQSERTRGIEVMRIPRTSATIMAATLFGAAAGAQGTPLLFTVMPGASGSGIAAHGCHAGA